MAGVICLPALWSHPAAIGQTVTMVLQPGQLATAGDSEAGPYVREERRERIEGIDSAAEDGRQRVATCA